jgi:heat shock protein HspQ
VGRWRFQLSSVLGRASTARIAECSLAHRPKPYYFNVMGKARVAKFPIGAVVKHRLFPFRGVVFDIDPEFANTEEWYAAIPAEVRPRKDQPFYHLFAENAETEYIAYVSEQNLLPDESGEPVRHPQVKETFQRAKDGSYKPREQRLN